MILSCIKIIQFNTFCEPEICAFLLLSPIMTSQVHLGTPCKGQEPQVVLVRNSNKQANTFKQQRETARKHFALMPSGLLTTFLCHPPPPLKLTPCLTRPHPPLLWDAHTWPSQIRALEDQRAERKAGRMVEQGEGKGGVLVFQHSDGAKS